MTPGPLPPHERAWRHPSELAAPAHEPTSRLGHILIGSTAAISLLLVAWLAISMTPRRYGDANQVGVASSDSAAATSFGLAAGSAGTDLATAEHVLRAMSTVFGAQSGQVEPPTVVATFAAGADRPAATEPPPSIESTVVTSSSSSATIAATVFEAPADAAASTETETETEAIGATSIGDGELPASSDASGEPDSTAAVDSTSEAAAPADSGVATTSTSSTTSTSTTSTTSTTSSTTSTTSTTTIAPPSSPKEFS